MTATATTAWTSALAEPRNRFEAIRLRRVLALFGDRDAVAYLDRKWNLRG